MRHLFRLLLNVVTIVFMNWKISVQFPSAQRGRGVRGEGASTQLAVLGRFRDSHPELDFGSGITCHTSGQTLVGVL